MIRHPQRKAIAARHQPADPVFIRLNTAYAQGLGFGLAFDARFTSGMKKWWVERVPQGRGDWTYKIVSPEMASEAEATTAMKALQASHPDKEYRINSIVVR